jgi:hypothetical protein
MLDSRRKLLPGLVLTLLCGLYLSQAAAQQKPEAKPQPKVTSSGGETPEVATRFSDMVRARNAKGAAVPLKVEVKNWAVSRSARPFEMADQGFYIVHLTFGRITTEIAGKTTARNPGDFWVVEKGQRMAISMKRPHESAGLQTIAVNPGH